MSQLESIQRPDQKTCPSYLAKPTGKPRGGIVLIQEWWGLNEQMKKVAGQLAEQGYLTLVPDLYRGKLTKDPDEATHYMGDLDFIDAAEQDVAGCVAHLKDLGASRVAVSGFCMGGALTLLAAAKLDSLSAAVCFYGIPPAEAADLSQIKIPLQAHFAEHDDWCTPDAIAALEATLKRGKVDHRFFSYDAQHAFMNEERPEVYASDHAAAAWKRALTFFESHLAS